MEILCAASWRQVPGTLLPPGGHEYILQEECCKRKIGPEAAKAVQEPGTPHSQAEKHLDKGKKQNTAYMTSLKEKLN